MNAKRRVNFVSISSVLTVAVFIALATLRPSGAQMRVLAQGTAAAKQVTFVGENGHVYDAVLANTVHRSGHL